MTLLHGPTKINAERLRKRGYSLNEISRQLKIAKSTASIWLRDIPLSTAAKQRIEKRRQIGRTNAFNTRSKKASLLNQKYLSWGKKRIYKFKVSKLYAQLFCSLLYWAEGGKFTLNRLEFTNSDPTMIQAFLKFLRKGFVVDEEKLRANIHIHEYHSDLQQKEFWSKITNIPISKFNKSYLKPHTKKIIRENYQGCVRICYYSADTARKVRSLYQALAKI